jgi:cyclophilin family peptidyl-prolyl cis-trans isomerase/HEAT repeat protein
MKKIRPILIFLCVASLVSQVAGDEQAKSARQAVPPGIHIRIIQLEDERNLNGDELIGLLKHQAPEMRERAALAIGRIGDKRGTEPLIKVLQSDEVETVRAMAAFALGEIEDARAASALLEVVNSSNGSLTVRARAIEALGKIASVRANAAQLGKTTLDSINQSLLDQLFLKPANDRKLLTSLTITALMRLQNPASVALLTQQLRSADADFRALAANALSRLRQPIQNAVPDLIEALADVAVDARANAARALSVSMDLRAVEPLIKSLNDKDARAQINIIRALAAIGDKRAVEPVIQLGQSKIRMGDPNLLLEIAAALGKFKDARALPLLQELQRFFSPTTMPEIEIAVARLNEGDASELHQRLSELAKPACHDWKQATVAAQTLGALLPTKDGGVWERALSELLVGPLGKLDQPACDERGLPEFMRSFAKLMLDPAHSSFLKGLKGKDVGGKIPESLDFLPYFHNKLKATDVIVRATAATILGEQSNELSLSPLLESFKQSKNDPANDAKLAILTAVSKYKKPEAIEGIKSALNDPDHLVRRHAVDLLKQMGAGDFSDRIGIAQTGHDNLFYQRLVARLDKKITATIHTDKGKIKLELLPQDAPITVDSFVTLARKGYFNNLSFHRVVPNFVIQGGDPRGDGEGGPGYQIRCEVNTRPYTRGTVGMALSGKDTGGSQFFITHSPQPHLDGGYTVFGQVVSGMEVVDRIARGDFIRKIEISEGR